MKQGKTQTRLKDGTNVIKTSEGGMKKLRSPSGGGQYAVPTTLPNGQQVLRTPDGRMYVEKKL
jgi:hypothetical protein